MPPIVLRRVRRAPGKAAEAYADPAAEAPILPRQDVAAGLGSDTEPCRHRHDSCTTATTPVSRSTPSSRRPTAPGPRSRSSSATPVSTVRREPAEARGSRRRPTRRPEGTSHGDHQHRLARGRPDGSPMARIGALHRAGNDDVLADVRDRGVTGLRGTRPSRAGPAGRRQGPYARTKASSPPTLTPSREPPVRPAT